MSIWRKVSSVSSVVLALSLALCLGDGRALEGWVLWYVAGLAMVSLLGQGVDLLRKEV